MIWPIGQYAAPTCDSTARKLNIILFEKIFSATGLFKKIRYTCKKMQMCRNYLYVDHKSNNNNNSQLKVKKN